MPLTPVRTSTGGAVLVSLIKSSVRVLSPQRVLPVVR